MDINQVIEMGSQIPETFMYGKYTIVGLFLSVFGGAIFLSGAIVKRYVVPAIIGGCMFFLGSGLFVAMKDIEKDAHVQDVERWKKTVVKPYIDSLPKEKKDIVFIKIESQLATESGGNRWYIDSSEVKLTPLTVSFKDEDITTLTSWYNASMKLTNEEKPYIEYQKVPRYLGHGVDAGYYNVKVHLPETYTFTEIK
ncbi:hypothetical protein ACFVS2_25835 [Brevibacillus sp. NPDC058079]|uniref:hypothetical protein n=1 Tax=Brevibacillus sp. NPDC058079 TaxID=3346330 RepID=UPI0036E80449